MPNTTLGPFVIGVNNRAREYDLPAGAVRDSTNLDLTLNGRTRVRSGQTLAVSGLKVSSAWSDGDRAFFKDGSILYEMFEHNAPKQIATGLSPRDVVYAKVPGRGYAFSDGVTIGRIDGQVAKPIGLAAPSQLAQLIVSGSGSMRGGTYQFATSFQSAAGEESGLSQRSTLVVPDMSSVSMALPQPVEPGVVSTLIYSTLENGEQLYLAAIAPAMSMTWGFQLRPSQGREPFNEFLRPLPPGNILAFWKGRLFSAQNGVLSYTAPFSGLYNPARDYIPFAAPISIVHPTDGGLWIVADHTYFLSDLGGDLKEVSPMGAVFGTRAPLPDSEEATWMTEHGLVMTSGGALDFLQQDNVSVSDAQKGVGLYREYDGLKQVITNLRDPTQVRGGAKAWFAASLHTGEVKDGFEAQ